MISFFLTVRDEGDRLRMWYVCRDQDNQPNVAYAESVDGVNWTKPNLGVFAYHGSTDNNLVGLHNLEGVVFEDPNSPPSERYTYVSSATPPQDAEGPYGLYRFHSPDGLRWTQDANPIIHAGSDTQNVTWWDEDAQQYVLYLRGWNPNPNRRKVIRHTLDSLRETIELKPTGRGVRNYFYDELPTVLICDELDASRTDIYNMSAQRYALDPDWYLGFPTFLRRFAKAEEPGYRGKHIGPAEVQFTGSRDGVDWHRYNRTAYASPPLVDQDHRNMVYMGTGHVVRGNEIWQYATEFHSRHGDVAARQARTDGFISRWVQRIDGFVSADTGNAMGWMRTTPVEITGDKLVLNLNTGALGELRVGVIDLQTGRAVAGMSVDDCKPIQGNATNAIVEWTGDGEGLSALQGQRVELEITSNRTKLYSIRFE